MSNPTNTTFDKALWDRLERFQIDDPANALSFTRRLARENGWSHAFASRVMGEYKRFVYLAMTAGHEVTPSDEVDQAWHLHLTYTRSYWDGLCGGVLGRPLHHGPTKGGRAEGERFEEQYERTLASYRTAFGAEPPSDVWPPAEIRFGEAAGFVRVNQSRAWVLPKPWRVDRGRPLVVAASLAVVLPPVAAGAAWNPLDFDGPTFLTFYAIVCFLAVSAAIVLRAVLRSAETLPGHAASPDDAESLAALRGGWPAVFQSAMAGLVADKAIEINKRGFFSTKQRVTVLREPNADDTELQQAILSKRSVGRDIEVNRLGRQSRPQAEESVERLEQMGLLETAESWRPVKTCVVLLMGSATALGAVKLAVGFWRDKPIGFLLAGVFAMVALTVVMAKRPHRSLAGRRCLAQRKAEHESLQQRIGEHAGEPPRADVAMAVGLFGLAACPSPDLLPLRQACNAMPPSSGGGNSASGCGGSGCGGGGCGGCGGCGG